MREGTSVLEREMGGRERERETERDGGRERETERKTEIKRCPRWYGSVG